MADETAALDLDLFDNTKNGYVPAERKKRKIVQRPKLVAPKPISRQQAASEERASNIAAAKASLFALVMLIVLGSLIYSSVVLTNLQMDLSKANAELKLSKSEAIALEMEMNSMISTDKVEEYAQTKLGMVKRENYQVKYFDLSQDSGAKAIK